MLQCLFPYVSHHTYSRYWIMSSYTYWQSMPWTGFSRLKIFSFEISYVTASHFSVVLFPAFYNLWSYDLIYHNLSRWYPALDVLMQELELRFRSFKCECCNHSHAFIHTSLLVHLALRHNATLLNQKCRDIIRCGCMLWYSVYGRLDSFGSPSNLKKMTSIEQPLDAHSTLP